LEIGFVHIGMMKTASTYMQNVWMNEQNYSLSWRGNFELLENLRNSVKKNKLNPDIKINIRTDMPYKQGEKIVISNEGFSSAFMNEPEHQKKIPQFIDLSSRVLGKIATISPNLLIIVREPYSWIKSVYIQAIKQGWSGTAQEFIDNQADLIVNGLDMRFIYKSYARFFRNIVVVPFELLKKNESDFWEVISDKFNLPAISVKISPLNESLELEKVYILSRLNEISRFIVKALKASKTYNFIQEKEKILGSVTNDGKWVNRRFLEHGTEEEINEIKNILNIRSVPESFLKFILTNEQKEKINNNYNLFLKTCSTNQDIITLYNMV